MRLKAIAFDTGGTVLDWHSGIRDAFAAIGSKHGLQRDWANIANQYRRLAMKGIVGQCQPTFNMDDVHFRVLEEVFKSNDLSMFSEEDRQLIAGSWHKLSAWGDSPVRCVQSVSVFRLSPSPCSHYRWWWTCRGSTASLGTRSFLAKRLGFTNPIPVPTINHPTGNAAVNGSRRQSLVANR